MNYGEEIIYWYLRLNGFFPINNFVIHKSSEVPYTSDCDLLAIRLPHVYEEIGGKEDDWDNFLKERLDLNKTIGIICEVKTGDYDAQKLFKPENIKYSLLRLGFISIEKINDLAIAFDDKSVITIDEKLIIAKLLVANSGEETSKYLFQNLQCVKSFISKRIEKYPKEKYRDRMFFQSIMLQNVIDDKKHS